MKQRWAWGCGIVALTAALGSGCAATEQPGDVVGGGGAGGGGAGGGDVDGCINASDCAALDGPCVKGACVNGACEVLPSNDFGACDDGLFCTVDDTCRDGVCTGGMHRFCPSMDGCHIGVCDENADACENIVGNEGATCEDGAPCTLAGKCSAGVCIGALPIDCTVLSGPCTVGVCDSAIGCVAVPAKEGIACDDAKSDFCTAGRCTAGRCETAPANEGNACDDGLFCTVGEACHAGVCGGGGPRPCAAPSTCWSVSCDEQLDVCVSMPGNDGAACDDGSPCTEETSCKNGACTGGTAVNDGEVCEDGLACTTGEICAAGACVTSQQPLVYFVEDFASNAKGWTLGPEWEIGPTKASSGGAFGSDPAADHTPTADNGVAAVVLGGNASTVQHPFYYLESPPFDMSGAQGSVVLGFYRWLNSDFAPYMDNVVEVWNGANWTILWESGSSLRVQDSPPVGTGWTYVEHDVTAYKSAAMRIRFGVAVGGAPLKVGSWNVDDVVVGDVACP